MKTGAAGQTRAKAARVAGVTKRRSLRVHQAPERFDFAMVDPEHAHRVLADLAIGPYPLPVAGGFQAERQLDSLGLTVARLDSLARRGWVVREIAAAPGAVLYQYVLTDQGRTALGRWRTPAEGGSHGGE